MCCVRGWCVGPGRAVRLDCRLLSREEYIEINSFVYFVSEGGCGVKKGFTLKFLPCVRARRARKDV